jgi:hypothetical protein
MVAVLTPLAGEPRLTEGAPDAGSMTQIEVTAEFTVNVVAVASYRTLHNL